MEQGNKKWVVGVKLLINNNQFKKNIYQKVKNIN